MHKTHNNQKHGFHLVDPSPWPMLTAFSALMMVFGFVLYMHSSNKSQHVFGCYTTTFGLILIMLMTSCWWSDVVREGTMEGQHTCMVQKGLKLGMVLFILSEVMFFFAFFWAFFHSSFNPSLSMGGVWPPAFMIVIDPWKMPLLNTVFLLTSGASMTYSHYAITEGCKTNALGSLAATVLLATIFSALQTVEYCTATFTISDNIYATTFYMITGLHGFHVFVGALFLKVCLTRLYLDHFTIEHHLGFEAAAWYWHFVDVVWLFVFIFVYWWGGAWSNLRIDVYSCHYKDITKFGKDVFMAMSQAECCCSLGNSTDKLTLGSGFLFSPIEQFEIMPLIPIHLGWFDVSMTNQTIALFLMFSVVLSLRTSLTSCLDHTHLMVPIRFQHALEKYLKGLLSLSYESMSKLEGAAFFPMMLTLSFYMMCLNVTGLMPHTAAMLSHVAVTITMSGSFFIGMNMMCVERFGIKFFTLLLPPNTSMGVALMLVPVEGLSFFCSPLSLATSLFANSMGGHTLVKIVAGCAWGFVNCSGYSYVSHGVAVLMMVPLMVLETSVAFIQSAVFVNLICMYIGEGLSL